MELEALLEVIKAMIAAGGRSKVVTLDLLSAMIETAINNSIEDDGPSEGDGPNW